MGIFPVFAVFFPIYWLVPLVVPWLALFGCYKCFSGSGSGTDWYKSYFFTVIMV